MVAGALGTGDDPHPRRLHNFAADVLGDVHRQHRPVLVAPPVGVHQVGRPHGAATPRTAHCDAHVPTVRAIWPERSGFRLLIFLQLTP